ncbi:MULTISPECIES: DUF2231 domain-containing protein [Halomonas]|uniref:DUF2231 domain-containing protein n=1 Tax=Halomonas citrativorans TaxID=2742612 RepID=A0A1R4I590_9GAMM|nr:DUF2231 domain-containing protein [Halomonas citrativorans]MBE0404037.1 DUF2231 domain-containing protein [Halomonas citrativorans]SJN14985.1 Gll3326 protein [Halomonas citrativorans]
MANSNRRNIKSRASISGHPLHPLMVHFPVAALMALVACDLGYWYTDDPFWLRVGLWLAGIGALGGWLASIAGTIDLVSVGQIRRLITGWSHAIVAVVMLSLASLNWLIRFSEPELVLPWGIAVSVVTAGLVALAGWLGGQLVYEHAVGVEVEE